MSTEKPVIFISISTGWAIRNFFHTGIIEKLKENFKVVIFTTAIIKECLIKQGYDKVLVIITIDKYQEPFLWRLFRRSKKKIYMEGRKSETEAIWEKRRPLYQKISGKVIKSVLTLIKPSLLLNWVETLDMKINKSKELSEIFLLYKPVIYFATHASTFFEEFLLRSAFINDVPVVYMVLSWDHLSSKVILSKKYYSIFVWNKLTKSEILKTYPSYRDDQIKVLGVPQYDIYSKKPEISYSEWCSLYGLKPNKRTLLFSTMPQVRHEQQHVILEKLLETIVEGKILPNNIQVLIKCHPFDNTDKYDSLLDRFPVSIYRTNLKVGESQDKWVPSQEEMIISRDCLYFCNININIFSTVTLEAAYLDKPIIHIAFDPQPVVNRIPCKEYYKFDHFKKITRMNVSKMVYGFEELYSAINNYLDNPDLSSQERKNLVEAYFNVEAGFASDNIVRELIKFKNNR